MFKPHRCPECDEVADAIVESLHRHIGIDVDPETGEWFDYLPEEIDEVFWETSEPIEIEPGHVLLRCPNQHEWKAASI